MIKITAHYGLSQLDKSEPPERIVYVCGPWLERMRRNKQVLTEFGDVRKLAQIPSGKASGSWARSIGCSLHQKWREWAAETEIEHVGEKNKPTPHFPRPLTRRELLMGDHLFRAADPDPEEILNSDNPDRAKEYWEEAIRKLKGAGVIGYYKEIGQAPNQKRGWQNAWQDQELDIRPKSPSDVQAIAEVSRSNRRHQKQR